MRPYPQQPTNQPQAPYLSFRAAVEESQRHGGTIIPLPSPSCLSFQAAAEESQRHGGTIIPIPSPLLAVIPSGGRGIPRVRGNDHCHPQSPPGRHSERQPRNPHGTGEPSFPCPAPPVCHSERQPRNPNGAGEPSLPYPQTLLPCNGGLGMAMVVGPIPLGFLRKVGMTGEGVLRWEGWLMGAVGIPRLSLGITGKAPLRHRRWHSWADGALHWSREPLPGPAGGKGRVTSPVPLAG